MRSVEITSSPKRIGDIINECIKNSNSPLWAGLRAYGTQKGDINEK